MISFPSFQLLKILFPIVSLCKIHFSTSKKPPPWWCWTPQGRRGRPHPPQVLGPGWGAPRNERSRSVEIWVWLNSMVYDVYGRYNELDNYTFHGGYKPTYNWAILNRYLEYYGILRIYEWGFICNMILCIYYIL